jgi:cell division FtsZ-interacting protein ZapD
METNGYAPPTKGPSTARPINTDHMQFLRNRRVLTLMGKVLRRSSGTIYLLGSGSCCFSSPTYTFHKDQRVEQRRSSCTILVADLTSLSLAKLFGLSFTFSMLLDKQFITID